MRDPRSREMLIWLGVIALAALAISGFVILGAVYPWVRLVLLLVLLVVAVALVWRRVREGGFR